MESNFLEEVIQQNMEGLRFDFENCESIFLPIECINVIDRYKYNELLISISNYGRIKYISDYSDNNLNPIDRIAKKDITRITILIKEETNELGIMFDKSNGIINKYQFNTIKNYNEINILFSKHDYFINKKRKLNEKINNLKNELEFCNKMIRCIEGD